MLVSSTPQNTTPELSPINVTVAQYLTFCGGSRFEKDFLETTTMTASQVQNNNSLSLPYKHAARSLQQIKTLSSGITSEHKSKVSLSSASLYEGAPLSRWSPTHAPRRRESKEERGVAMGCSTTLFVHPSGGIFWRELRGCVTVFPSGADEKDRLPEKSKE